jgi:hypothetical protein
MVGVVKVEQTLLKFFSEVSTAEMYVEKTMNFIAFFTSSILRSKSE